MADSYQRPAATHRTEIVVVNSRFITTIARADTVETARAFIAQIRQEMPDASHHVYAFRAGYGNSVTEGMSDDGEPSGTSGPPTLAVLRGSDIGDIVLVTTRYFGGTKLGTGGLVRAYSEAAKTALSGLKTEIKAPKVRLGLDMDYSQYERVKRLLAQYNATINEENFSANVTVSATVLQADSEQFKAELANLTAGQVEPIVLETVED